MANRSNVRSIFSAALCRDYLTGAQVIEEARLLCAEIDALLGECGFELDKWRSNQKNVVPNRITQQPNEVLEQLNELRSTTVLGLRWFPETDQLTFKFEPPPVLSAKDMTKRRLLSQIAQLFDPNSYIGPVVIVAKS